MDVKIALQAEIDQYRKILEGEEARTGLPSPKKGAGIEGRPGAEAGGRTTPG